MRTASSSFSWIINCWYINFLIIILLSAFYSVITPTTARLTPYPPSTANLSTSWIISYNADSQYIFDSNQIATGIFNPILLTETNVTRFALSFFCQLGENRNCNSKNLFAIFIVTEDYEVSFVSPPLVWSANRDHPVQNNATLDFTAAGELVLRDADGTMVWTTNTAGKSVIGMNLTDAGNLLLYDVNHQVVWQSFDHPADCLLPGQKLYQGQQLTSSTNWTSDQKDMFSLEVTDEGLFAYIESNPPQAYFSANLSALIVAYNDTKIKKGKSYLRLLNGSLSVFILSVELPEVVFPITQASSAQYMKLMPDGHLKVFGWQSNNWQQVGDLFTGSHDDDLIGECDYPLACGRNALCLNNDNAECVCPVSNPPEIQYFRAVNNIEPNLGCSEITPLTCNATQDQDLIAVDYSSYFTFTANLQNVSLETCKQECLRNCSCKAALFQYDYDSNSSGECYLPTDLLTLATDPVNNYKNFKVFIKVQNPFASQKRKNQTAKVLGPAIGIPLIVVVGFVMFIVHKKRQHTQTEEEQEECFDQVRGLPTRFSYGELKAATGNFCKKLGEGGFGTVFEGILEDGSKIAVKYLQGHGQVNKSFLAEVESIGSIHHVNLVRLRGYSAWKSQRLLVYDFMCNGSLDHWIYHGDLQGHVLDWECRKNIILHIAKGLAYLHEECRQQIIHLDIKPQNILLDDDFNAKVSDFGLSKLVDKNKTQVMTTIKGTPGYIAPECWSSSIITEKVDVYSFGIVVLEILCGRKIFDRSLPEESWHLLAVFQKSWEQGTLLDMVDKYSENMQANGAEVVEMMKVASWCLQTDSTRRPSMSTVVKVLEDGMSVESNLDYNFTDLRMLKTAIAQEKELTQMMPSILSWPR
uniref:G-type lectin S-receptor-like serine/threonine-protein kinase SD2-5 n=1 Tax=Erigeron canadensis TaxID=72917 RepID=UPI001CB9A8EC|nr:G-type lectin S-receptor-like serine/threonine-protein kinase SD2-5 [Erigeron canadensis]